MSSDNTANGAILGTATTAGFLTSFLNDWKIAIIVALGILLLGLAIILLKKKHTKK